MRLGKGSVQQGAQTGPRGKPRRGGPHTSPIPTQGHRGKLHSPANLNTLYSRISHLRTDMALDEDYDTTS